MLPKIERYKRFNSGKTMSFMLLFLCIVVLVVSLKLAAPILIPFFVAVVLAFVFDPVINLFEKIKIPRVLGIALVVILIGILFWLLGLIILGSAKTMLGFYPRYETRFLEIYRQIASLLQLPYDNQLSFSSNLLSQLGVRQRIHRILLSTSENFISFAKNLGLVLLFMVFLMAERRHFKEKLHFAFEGKVSDKIRNMFSSIVEQTTRFLRLKFLISLATGLLAWGLFLVIGLDFAIFWAALTFAMNFIPTFGSIIAGLSVGLFALVQFWPSPLPIVLIGLGILAINMGLGNIMEPKIQGDSLNLSPFVILLSLSAWGYIWGFMGLVLAVPLTVVVKIICENIPMLEPASVIMGAWKVKKTQSEAENEDNIDSRR